MNTGECKLLPNSLNRLKKIYDFGVEKVFNYKRLGLHKVLVYRQGVQFVVSKEDFNNSFIIIK